MVRRRLETGWKRWSFRSLPTEGAHQAQMPSRGRQHRATRWSPLVRSRDSQLCMIHMQVSEESGVFITCLDTAEKVPLDIDIYFSEEYI